MKKAIPLEQGDVRWVFPDLDDPGSVRDALAESEARMRGLADRLGVRAGQTGSGLEYEYEEGAGGFAHPGVFAVIRLPGIWFTAELYVPRRCGWDLRPGPPWQAQAEVMVSSCDNEQTGEGDDCRSEFVAEWSCTYDVPADAVRGLTEATAWLDERVVSENIDAWRALRGHCRHDPAE